MTRVYNAFFGFRTDPFASTPDPAFFFRSSHHDAALKGLLLSVEARMGVISLVGDQGTGKTMVLECLRNSLPSDIPCAFLRDSRISLGQFLETIAADLQLDLRFKKKSAPHVFLALTRLMTQQARSGRTVVLIVDEAHNLPANVFEEIVHIASLHHDKVKEIQTVFAGRPHLQERLAALNPDRVKQRAMLSRSLYPFAAPETQEYVAFRLACAGMPKQTIFPREVLEDIHNQSQGFAPAIHELCDKLLLTAFSASSKVCTREIRDQVFKKPHGRLFRMVEDVRTIVTAKIDRPRLAAPPMPEPPPMQTALLRIAVESRPGSLRPWSTGLEQQPVSLEAITFQRVLPRGRFEPTGAELFFGAPGPMPIGDCAKASVLRSSAPLGLAVSLPLAGPSICLPKTATGEPRKAGPSQLPAARLIPSERYLRLGPPLTGAPSYALPFLYLRERDLQPICPAMSLQPASPVPCSRVPFTPFSITWQAPSSNRSIDVKPVSPSLVGRPIMKAARASLEPIIRETNTLLPLPLNVRPTPPPTEAPINSLSFSLLSAWPSLPARPISTLKPADPPPPSLPPPTWTQRDASPEGLWPLPTNTFAGIRKPLVSPGKVLLTLVVSILAILAFYGAPPAVRAATGASQQGWQRAQHALLNRAAVALDEDFRAGLGNWTNRGGSAPAWTADASAFVRPGALALYRPSLGMVDYQMQFLGTIDKKNLSWVVRAADFKNYYVIRLVILKPGPLPAIGVTRYAVVNGIPQKRVTTPLLMRAQADTVYRVRLDMEGDQFALSIQDQPVDSWSEPRLGHGGIGFFSETDARSRIASLQVRGHYDTLGRLCAFLMPFTISNDR